MKTLGTTLFHGTSGSAASTALAGVRAIQGLPEQVFDEYDNSEIDQSSLVKDFVQTLSDGGTLAMRMTFTHTKLAAIQALHTGIKRSWKVVFSGGNNITFEGNLKKVGLTGGGEANTRI